MFDGLALLGLIGAVRQIWKEKTEPKLPANARFDYDKFHEEMMSGIPDKIVEQRLRAGYYHTTERKQFDLVKYNEDVKTGISPYELEKRRLEGVYGDVKPRTRGSKNYSEKELRGNYVLDVERYEYKRKKYPELFEGYLIPSNYCYMVSKSVYTQY